LLLFGCSKEQDAVKASSQDNLTGESVTINSACYANGAYSVNVTFAGANPSTQILGVAYYSNDCKMCDPDAPPQRVSTVTKNNNGTFTVSLPINSYGTTGTIRAAILDNAHNVLAIDNQAVSGQTCN